MNKKFNNVLLLSVVLHRFAEKTLNQCEAGFQVIDELVGEDKSNKSPVKQGWGKYKLIYDFNLRDSNSESTVAGCESSCMLFFTSLWKLTR